MTKAILLALAACVLTACTGSAEPQATTPTSEAVPAPDAATTPATEGAFEPQTFADLSQDHTSEPVEYPQTPPVGGPHADEWQTCGFYSEPVANENAVHSLEHGAVWITYRPDVDPGPLRVLAMQEHVLVSPFPDLPAPVVASAWGIQLHLEGPDDPRAKKFVRRYAAGPQTPEPGAPCAGGVGTPEQSA